MPELLLSSAPANNLSSNPVQNLSSKSLVSVSSDANGLKDGNIKQVKGEGGFTNVLSSVVQPASISTETIESPVEEDVKKITEALQGLLTELSEIDPDSKILSEIRTYIDGQDMSTLNFETAVSGASLPEFISNIESMIDTMLNTVDEGSGLSLLEGIDEESMDALQSAFLQVNAALSGISKPKAESNLSSAANLLGFSFNGGQGKSGQWNRYDPQQISKAISGDGSSTVSIGNASTGNTSTGNASISGASIDKASMSETFIGNTPAGNQHGGLLSGQLVAESDQSFQLQMDELISGKALGVSDATDTISDLLIDGKDKTATRFSDIQIRTPNSEGIKQYSTTLTTPVNSQDWHDELSQKIVWFTGRNIQSAEMHLNPAELGPIDVKIHVQNDVATVSFNVNNASVKDLLESNVIRLREMMEANGVNMGDVNVDSGDRDQSHQSESKYEGGGLARSGQDADGELEIHEQELTIKQSNIVDYFV